MPILATMNPGNIQVDAGTAFTSSDIRTLVLDASAEDTVSSWMFPGGVQHASGKVKFDEETTYEFWAAYRFKSSALDANEKFSLRFYTDANYFTIDVVLDGNLVVGHDGIAQPAVPFTSAFVVDDWSRIDIRMSIAESKLFLYHKEILLVTIPVTFPVETVKYASIETTANIRCAEILFSTDETRGWRVQSSAPTAVTDSTFDGAAAAVTSVELTKESIRSVGIGTTAKFDYPDVTTDMKVAAVSVSAVAQTLGKPDSPVFVHYLEENGNSHLVGVTATDDDTENTPVSAFASINPLTGKEFTRAEINASVIRTENIGPYMTMEIGSSNASRHGYYAADPVGSVSNTWSDGTAFERLAYDEVAMEVFMEATNQTKWNDRDKLTLVFTDAVGALSKREVTWDGTKYRGPLNASNQNFLDDRVNLTVSVFIIEQ